MYLIQVDEDVGHGTSIVPLKGPHKRLVSYSVHSRNVRSRNEDKTNWW